MMAVFCAVVATPIGAVVANIAFDLDLFWWLK